MYDNLTLTRFTTRKNRSKCFTHVSSSTIIYTSLVRCIYKLDFVFLKIWIKSNTITIITFDVQYGSSTHTHTHINNHRRVYHWLHMFFSSLQNNPVSIQSLNVDASKLHSTHGKYFEQFNSVLTQIINFGFGFDEQLFLNCYRFAIYF